jgi:hypothetical protein
MPADATRRLARPTSVLLAIATTVVMAACSGAQQGPSGQARTASPPPSPTPRAAASATPGATADGGPADYAAWVEIQGFGGSSGLREVLKGAEWIRDHPTEGSAFDVESTMRLGDNLASWLDANPATPCWTEYHATMRASLDRIHEAFALARDARAAGRMVPGDVAEAVVAESQAAFDLAEPEAC